MIKCNILDYICDNHYTIFPDRFLSSSPDQPLQPAPIINMWWDRQLEQHVLASRATDLHELLQQIQLFSICCVAQPIDKDSAQIESSPQWLIDSGQIYICTLLVELISMSHVASIFQHRATHLQVWSDSRSGSLVRSYAVNFWRYICVYRYFGVWISR